MFGGHGEANQPTGLKHLHCAGKGGSEVRLKEQARAKSWRALHAVLKRLDFLLLAEKTVTEVLHLEKSLLHTGSRNVW